MAHVPWRTRCEYRCEHVTVYLNLVTPDASYGLIHYIDSPHARVERAVSTQSAGAIILVDFYKIPARPRCVPEPPILVRGRVYGLAMSNVRFVTSSVCIGRLTWRLVSFVEHEITF